VTMTDQLKIDATKRAVNTSFPSKVASVKAYTSPPDPVATKDVNNGTE
jgi:hypothetical protein